MFDLLVLVLKIAKELFRVVREGNVTIEVLEKLLEVLQSVESKSTIYVRKVK